MRERIEAHSLVNSACNIVLPPGSYQLLLMEAPKVPPHELREAVRWKVKELIRFPVEEAVVDAFPLPDDSRRMGGAMVYVVAVKRDLVEEVLSFTEGAGLKVESIDIAEMALRNLAELNSDDNRGVAVVRLRQGAGNLALIRQGNLYLSRQFELDYNAGLLDALPEENLVLELQRSFDYYERQMGQAPPSNIYVCGENVSTDKITQGLRTNLAARVSLLAPEEFLAQGAACAEPILQLCVGAIGGALRNRAARA